MKVLEKVSGQIVEYNDGYAARLIEQGKAVIAPEAEPVENAAEAAEEAPAPKAKSKKL